MGDNEAAASNSTGASALSSPAFRTYLCGILAANIGFRMQSIALGILVRRYGPLQ